MGDITEAEHSDHSFFLVDDRQPPDLLRLHKACRIVRTVAIATPDNALRHDISGGKLGDVLASSDAPHGDITVRHHAD